MFPRDTRIRKACPSDAVGLLDLKLRLDRESAFIMVEPGERPADPEIERRALEEAESRANSVVLVADLGDEFVGYLEARGGAFRRNRHSAVIVLGVRAAFAGRGLGRQLLEAADGWARSVGLTRLELTVMQHNHHARNLYREHGFTVEGCRRASLNILGGYVAELTLAKLLACSIEARALRPEDRDWAARAASGEWGYPVVVRRGELIRLNELPGVVAFIDGQRTGVAQYRIAGEQCEIVSLTSFREGLGVGRELLETVRAAAVSARCRRISVVVTNDNVRALAFFQRAGFNLSRLHLNSLDAARELLKARIRVHDETGVRVAHELELVDNLSSA